MENNNVLLVFGGNSFEHDISIITALTIFNRAKISRYKLIPLYLSKNNEWLLFLKDNFRGELFKNFKQNCARNGFVKAYFKKDDYIYTKL